MSLTAQRRKVAPWLKWNASQLTTATNCPRQAFYEYFLKLPRVTPPYTALGSALHEMFRKFFSYTSKKRLRFHCLDEPTLLKIWQGWWWSALFSDRPPKKGRARPHGFGGYDDPPEIVPWREDDVAGKMFGRGVNVLKRFFTRFDQVRHDGNSRLVERSFSFWWEGIFFTGRIDRLDLEPDGGVIYDYKSGLFSEPMRQTGVQPTFYQLAHEKFFRRSKTGHRPLKALRIYDYNGDQFQDLPLRDDHEFGLLLKLVQEGALYFDGVLNDRRVPAELQREFHLFNPNDILRGDITPRLPRADHCKYCPYVEQCRRWERGDLPTARELYRQKRQLVDDTKVTLQERIPFSDLPVVQRGRSGFAAFSAPKPDQTALAL